LKLRAYLYVPFQIQYHKRLGNELQKHLHFMYP
jgi:hypothetical protein